ncbi:transglutaminaseTgpA domain-containing protein [Moraxella equi]|uniref:Uncharacterized protein involved in cytokinesis, contains TGc (Transglutaminase/protease-like) domain n=1 Tax=Moraxella equi TaxID=60442 RepID=A0A378QVZ6_9GAMM|nr:transglutaminaseTgpA domain-containing protein [Moraxella equi]OPH38883.1 hypothetical protein B5J93_05170 [Moraxella equi]STZ04602.1 Uncharacterized protein involved in cytokinesis, contains TGc (transglutaminase/protease-like) domain [Moraxella equi]
MNSTFHDFGQGRKTLTTSPQKFWQKILALPAYHWLLLAMASLVLPHAMGIPAWLLVALIISVIMQKPSIKARLYRLSGGRLRRIYQVVQVLLFLGGTVAIWVSFGQAFGVDVAVSFLVLCFVAKAWELYEKRDAYVALNLALFTLASAFLIRQDLSVAVVGLPTLMMILIGFIAIGDDDNADGSGRLRALAMITLPAIPLLVVLFLFFPRLPPMWSLPMAGKSATTGVSDSMSPGDFSNLSQSTELAFRAEFDGQMPSRHEMYWRGLVFSDFDGVTWRQSEFSPHFWSSRDGDKPPAWAMSAYQGMEHHYRVILEPTEQNWLFALDYPRLHPERGMGMTGDFTLRHYYPISTQKRYRASYFSQPKVDIELTDVQKRINLRLPEDGNEQARAFASELYAQTGDPVRYAQAVQNFITTGGFSYTLSPPVLRDDRIDEFLFGTKAGFCEHYASSFTFLMRSAGIPARVVAGYQGGELGRDGQSWEVRQMDAHAWTEVWFDGQGWVRIDPTAFVSPDRVEQGMNAVTEMGGASMFGDGMIGQWSYQQFKMLQTLRRYSDQMGYYWQKNVVGYDQDEQKDSLFKWFNIKSFAQQFWILVGGVGVLAVLFVGVMMYRRRRQYHGLDVPLVKLSAGLAKQDKAWGKGASEPYLTWLDRLKTPNNSEDIDELKGLYRKHRYGRDGQVDKAVVGQMMSIVKRLVGRAR